MGGFCTPTYTKLPEFKETVEGTEIPSWVAAAGRTLFERSAQLAEGDYPLYAGARTQTYTDGSKLTDAERQGMGILTSGAEKLYALHEPCVRHSWNAWWLWPCTLMGAYGASRADEGNLWSAMSLGNYQGATREELLGNYGQPARNF
jgi:hypothetical protein